MLPKVKEMLQTRVIYSKLSNDELIQIARQYSTRKELQTQCSGVDKLIYTRGIADEALSHIPLQRTDTYTKEFIFSEMKKYKSQKELQIKDSKVYNAAKKRKILKGFYEKIQNVHAGVSVGEVSLCLFFDRIFNSKFEKTRDIIKFGKSSLELDGYSKDLGIAFEHQGDQHCLDTYRGKSTAKIKEKDYFKVEFCKNNGIKLIIIRDIINFYKNDHKIVKDELKKEFNRLNIEIPELFYSTDIEIISPRDNRWTYEKLLTAAKKYQDYTSLLKEERGARDFVYKLKLTERLCSEMNWTSPKKVIKIQK